jgi:hypothetical protein
MMYVSDLLEILNRLDPRQKVRVVMTGLHTGEGGPSCRFTDTDPPSVKPDEFGTVELLFSDE